MSMSMSIPDRQMIQLAIVFVCLISSSFETKTKIRTHPAKPADCGSDENTALNDIDLCMSTKWPDGIPNPQTSPSPKTPESQCCYKMNTVCARANYMRDKCSPKSSFDQKVKDGRNEAMADCAKVGVTWKESLCDFGQTITDKCQQYKTYVDCKDISAGDSPGNRPTDSSTNANPAKESDQSGGQSLRYPAVTELLLVALLIKYFI